MSKITDLIGKMLSPIGMTQRESNGGAIGRHNPQVGIPFYLILLLAFLLGRTLIVNWIAPFGPAFYVSYRTALGNFSLVTALAVLAGSATLGQWNWFVPCLAAIIAITILTKPGKKTRWSRIMDTLIAGFCVFMARIGTAIAVMAKPSLSAYLSAFIEGLCTMVSGLIFVSALRGLAPAEDKPALHSGKANQTLVLLSLFAVGGLHSIDVYNLNIGVMVVMAGTFGLAYSGGPSVGALVGVLGGLAACLTGGEDPAIIGFLGILGVLSGIGGRFGKIEATLGYLSAGLAMSFFADSASSVRHMLLEQIIATVVIVLINDDIKRSLLEYTSCFVPNLQANRNEQQLFSKEIPRLDAISNTFLEMGRLFGQAAAGTAVSDAVFPEGATRTRTGDMLRNRISGRPRHGSKTRGGSRSVEASDMSVLDITTVKQLVEKVCDDCPNRAFCWEEHFGDTYEGFINLARKARLTGRLGLSDSSLITADRCDRFRELVIHINHEKQVTRLQKRLSSIESETSSCLAFQYRCLGRLMAGIEPVKAADISANAQSTKVSVKGTTVAASGVEKPGDMWARYDLESGKVLLVLVDGMGKGELAAKQSRDTISLLKSLIDCGLDHASCISFLNSALYLAWRPDSFVALDCLVIDAEVERAYFYKLGAPPSFIKKSDGNVLVVRGSKPPAGAVTDVFCYGSSEPVTPGDLIFLVSDGVFRSSPVPARAEHMLMMRLARLKENILDDCVKSLVNHSLRYQRQVPNDDITVVGALIDNI